MAYENVAEKALALAVNGLANGTASVGSAAWVAGLGLADVAPFLQLLNLASVLFRQGAPVPVPAPAADAAPAPIMAPIVEPVAVEPAAAPASLAEPVAAVNAAAASAPFVSVAAVDAAAEVAADAAPAPAIIVEPMAAGDAAAASVPLPLGEEPVRARARSPLEEDPVPVWRGVREVVFSVEDVKESAPPPIPIGCDFTVSRRGCDRPVVGLEDFARARRPPPPSNLPPVVYMTPAACEKHIRGMEIEYKLELTRQSMNRYRNAKSQYESKKAMLQIELAELDRDATIGREMEKTFIYVEELRKVAGSKECKRAAAGPCSLEEAKRLKR